MQNILGFASTQTSSFFPSAVLKGFEYKQPKHLVEYLLKRLADDGALEVSKLHGGDAYQITARGREIWKLAYYLNSDLYPGLHSDYYIGQLRLQDLAKEAIPPIQTPPGNFTTGVAKPITPVNINNLIAQNKKQKGNGSKPGPEKKDKSAQNKLPLEPRPSVYESKTNTKDGFDIPVLTKKNVTAFYSWQSDLPNETNQGAIRGAVRNAVSQIELDDADIKIKLEEATRDEPGSPDIPSTIFDKIKNADIFVCDLTTINSHEKMFRKFPNPNVAIELGYAAAYLGWNRIIILFNKHFGDFKTELPFDLEKRRVSPYNITSKEDKQGRKSLEGTLQMAIKAIIEKNPQKPAMRLSANPAQIKRTNDIKKISYALGQIHLATFDHFIQELPNKLTGRIFYFWYQYEYVLKSSDFHLYDKNADKLFKAIFDLWNQLMSYTDEYVSTKSGHDFTFYIPGDTFVSERSEQNFMNITKQQQQLKDQFTKLLAHVRENYLEIDIDTLSNEAWLQYQQDQKASPIGKAK